MFPKKGNVFPRGSGERISGKRYAAAMAAALRTELGETHQAVKIVMRWTGANERTVKNWLAGDTGPSGEHLVGIIQHSDAALEAILLLAKRRPALSAERLLAVRNTLAEMLKKIETVIE
jgi:hypothetical protein